MKKFVTLFCLLVGIGVLAGTKSISGCSINSSQPVINVGRCDEVFKNIAKKRVGPSDIELSQVPSPFVSTKTLKVIKNAKARKRKAIILHLYGIMNDKAKINKKWYKLYAKVYGYKLVKIKNVSVVLKNKKKKLELFLRKKNDKINISKNF